MNKYNCKFLWFILLLFSMQPAYSANYKFNTVKNGVALYIGMLPAEMIEGHKSQSMHGGIPPGMFRYHVAVSLFDDHTGERLKSVLIKIKLLDSKNKPISKSKNLEVMTINNNILYGNYFSVNKIGETYKIKVSVEFKDRKYEGFDVITDYPFVHI